MKPLPINEIVFGTKFSGARWHVILPEILKAEKNLFIYDDSTALYTDTYKMLKNNGYEVFVLTDVGATDAFNPFDENADIGFLTHLLLSDLNDLKDEDFLIPKTAMYLIREFYDKDKQNIITLANLLEREYKQLKTGVSGMESAYEALLPMRSSSAFISGMQTIREIIPKKEERMNSLERTIDVWRQLAHNSVCVNILSSQNKDVSKFDIQKLATSKTAIFISFKNNKRAYDFITKACIHHILRAQLMATNQPFDNQDEVFMFTKPVEKMEDAFTLMNKENNSIMICCQDMEEYNLTKKLRSTHEFLKGSILGTYDDKSEEYANQFIGHLTNGSVKYLVHHLAGNQMLCVMDNEVNIKTKEDPTVYEKYEETRPAKAFGTFNRPPANVKKDDNWAIDGLDNLDDLPLI